jgi:hypothetical protein
MADHDPSFIDKLIAALRTPSLPAVKPTAKILPPGKIKDAGLKIQQYPQTLAEQMKAAGAE